MTEQIQDIIHLIEKSELDQTIKDILIRDLREEGLTDFLREQIRAYCLEGIKIADAQITRAQATLENPQNQNPA